MKRRPLLLMLAAGAPALAAGGCERPLQVGISLLGWAAYEEQGRLKGIAPDLIAMLGTAVGCEMQLSLRPRARVMLDFQTGELDIVSSSLRSPDRDLAGDYEPYAYSGYDIVVLNQFARRVERLASLVELPRLKLGLVRGVQMPDAANAVIEGLAAQDRIEWAPDFQNLATRLEAGRFHVAVFPTAIQLKLRHDGQLSARFLALPLPESPPLPVGMYFSRKRLDEAQRRKLGLALRQLVRSGEVQRLYARYLGEAATRRMFEAGRAAAGGLQV